MSDDNPFGRCGQTHTHTHPPKVSLTHMHTPTYTHTYINADTHTHILQSHTHTHTQSLCHTPTYTHTYIHADTQTPVSRKHTHTHTELPSLFRNPLCSCVPRDSPWSCVCGSLSRCQRSRPMPTAPSPRSKWTLKKTWWSSSPSRDFSIPATLQTLSPPPCLRWPRPLQPTQHRCPYYSWPRPQLLPPPPPLL